ncbi:MAG: LPS-assembly protein LptD [Burkholderiales bacterium]|jgi:LPS-assembly protein|nr:LPS-assembly protein LptD [Burkholderiales bacterium]
MAFFRQKLLSLCVLMITSPVIHAKDADDDPPFVLREAAELSAISSEHDRVAFSLNPRVFSKGELNAQGLVFLDADETTGDNETVIAKGHVVTRSRFDAITADLITFDRASHKLLAEGKVVLRRQGSEVKGSKLEYERDTSTGNLQTPDFYLDDVGGRGEAEELVFGGPALYEAKNARFTTCQAPRDDWFLSANRMVFDTENKIGTAYGASLRFMSVPLFYSPWLEFPLSGDRKTGFLTPTYGTSGARGAELSLPFYWNIAPNYDATLTPRVMGRRGLQLGGQFRYLFDSPLPMNGQIEAEFLPKDRVFDNQNRYLMSWRHQQSLTSWSNAYVDLNKVSDDTYFADLADQIAVTSQTTLPREVGARAWHGPFMSLLRVQNFQTLKDSNKNPVTPPYNRAPQFNVTMSEWATEDMRRLGFSVSGMADLTRFRQGELSRSYRKPEGVRAVIHPALTWRAESLGGFIKARSSVVHRQYWLDDLRRSNIFNVGIPDPPLDQRSHVTIPIFSVDTGLIFERDTELMDYKLTQTLEPRLFYVYAPYRDQNNDPVFDTAVDDFNFAQLFNENRYVGYDRFGDANQLTAALTSRIYSEQGAEWLRVFAGERFYFSDQQVVLQHQEWQGNRYVAVVDEQARFARSSDILFGLEGQISNTWKATMLTEYNFGSGETERFNAGLRWSPKPGKILSGTWRYTRNAAYLNQNSTELRQFDIAAQWPLTSRWDAVARWNYSLSDKKTLEAIGALEYNADCWILRFAVHRLATTKEQTNTSFFVQLEFGGLGRIGSSPLEVLRRSLPGYTTSNDPSRHTPTPTYSVYPEY